MASETLSTARVNLSQAAAEQRLTEVARTQRVAPAGLSSTAEQAHQLDKQMKALGADLRDSVETANSRMQSAGRAVDVSLDKQTNMVVVTVTDRETGTKVRQIPPESAVNITRNIDRLTGILVDRTA
jgi:uncharacterized FlaG/YvyC family protein